MLKNPCYLADPTGCSPIENTFTVGETSESTRSWSHTFGVEMSFGYSWTAGTPFVEVTNEVSISASSEHSWGKEEKRSKTWSSYRFILYLEGLPFFTPFFEQNFDFFTPIFLSTCFFQSFKFWCKKLM